MQCFINGQEDISKGVKHPRYVACLFNGEVLCCVDDDAGNQDCEGQAPTRPTRPTTNADKVRAILAAHRATLTRLGRYDASPAPPRTERPDNRKP